MMSARGTATALTPSYRPEVDGLRAVAVLPVVLYHAGLGCPGGFVGVDVFFVISGYVISSLILREVAAGTFSLVPFWERRIRRILPALGMMVAAVLVAGWLFYLPEDLEHLAKSVLAQPLMAANFFFWRSGIGYFHASSDVQPLLHTWSLAVEEQFYLFFPLVLTFLVRRRPGSWRHWILGMAVISLVVCVATSSSVSYLSAAFYLLPSRAWELLVGALLAMHGGWMPASRRMQEAAGTLGLALIAWPVAAYSEQTRFPGLAALLPCLGAALVIASSEGRASLVGRFLSWRPIVFVGLISYPLYLWHWPVLTFAKYLDGQVVESSMVLRLGLMLASLGLAVLSWKFVETPFRQRRWLGGRRGLFLFAGVTSGLFLGLGGAAFLNRGFPERFPAHIQAFSRARTHRAFEEQVDLERAKAGRFVELGSAAHRSQPVHVFVWGDSHAKAIAPALDMLCREYAQRGMLAAHGGTAPVLHFVPPRLYSLGETAPAMADSAVSFIAAQKVPHVILVARWAVYSPCARFKESLVHTVHTLLQAGARVHVVKDVPAPGFEVPRVVALSAMRGTDLESLGISPQQHQKSEVDMQATFDELARMGAVVLDPADLFLTRQGNYGVVKDGNLLYFDDHHLTTEGASLLEPLFRPLFRAP